MTIALACVVMMLGACGESEKTYTVNVKDALGNSYSSGIVVQFMQNGEQVAMQACDENGVASKTLPAGDYTVTLSFTGDADAYHYEENLAFTDDATELDVILANKLTAEAESLFDESSEYEAYPVAEGCTYVDLTADHRNYFLFIPTKAGNYEFSIADGAKAEIGYYGAPHFVQSNNVAEVKDNKFSISVSATMIGSGDSGTATYVIGVDALDAETKNCVIGINRIGDAKKTIEDQPWSIYETTSELAAYTLPAGAQIEEFDLTAATDTYELVYNEDDGFYHLDSETGPLVLVRLAEDTDYIACFKTILDRSGISKYFFDDNGDLTKKESYSECLLEYIEYVDEAEGVYPLTEDLKYIIQQRGEYVGWWDIESAGYLFKDADGNNMTDINTEIAWLLMCCYIK